MKKSDYDNFADLEGLVYIFAFLFFLAVCMLVYEVDVQQTRRENLKNASSPRQASMETRTDSVRSDSSALKHHLFIKNTKSKN